jgi:hypothetical protein
LPKEIINLELLMAPYLLRALDSFNKRSRKEEKEDFFILDIDRIDYPSSNSLAEPRGSSNPHDIFSEGYYFMVSPNGKMIMGDAEALVKAQERPAHSEKPLPNRLYDAARGVPVERIGKSSSVAQIPIPKSRIPPVSHFAKNVYGDRDNVPRNRPNLGNPPTRLHPGFMNRFYEPLGTQARDNPQTVDGIRQANKLEMVFFRSTLPDRKPVETNCPNLKESRESKTSDMIAQKPGKRNRTIFNNGDVAASLMEKYSKGPTVSKPVVSESSNRALPRNPFRIAR